MKKHTKKEYLRSVRQVKSAMFWSRFNDIFYDWIPPILNIWIDKKCKHPCIPYVTDENENFVRFYTWDEMKIIMVKGFDCDPEEIE